MPTTGLLTATQYLKDNRLLPRGFDKATAPAEIAVYGSAARRPGLRRRAAIACATTSPCRQPGRYAVEAELRYQSIGYRWAHNLERYDAAEPKRFLWYYTSMSAGSSVVVATATATAQ